jgi:hypothetical protein
MRVVQHVSGAEKKNNGCEDNISVMKLYSNNLFLLIDKIYKIHINIY